MLSWASRCEDMHEILLLLQQTSASRGRALDLMSLMGPLMIDRH